MRHATPIVRWCNGNIQGPQKGKGKFCFVVSYEFIFLQVKTTTTAFHHVASARDKSTKSNPKNWTSRCLSWPNSCHFGLKSELDTRARAKEARRNTSAGLDTAAGIVTKPRLQSSLLRLRSLLWDILCECCPHKLNWQEEVGSCMSVSIIYVSTACLLIFTGAGHLWNIVFFGSSVLVLFLFHYPNKYFKSKFRTGKEICFKYNHIVHRAATVSLQTQWYLAGNSHSNVNKINNTPDIKLPSEVLKE